LSLSFFLFPLRSSTEIEVLSKAQMSGIIPVGAKERVGHLVSTHVRPLPAFAQTPPCRKVTGWHEALSFFRPNDIFWFLKHFHCLSFAFI
jgi:hypothetical protein